MGTGHKVTEFGHKRGNTVTSARTVRAPQQHDAELPASCSWQPRLSIGLPVYNGELYLRAAIGSLLRQTFRNFELIISDNCSTDATSEICAEFAASDSRVLFCCNERNLGAAANYNRVVELARGELFVWANHDDVWGETYLEKCVAALDRRPGAVLAFSRSARIDTAGAVVLPLMCDLGLDHPSPGRRLRRYHRQLKRRAHGWERKAARDALWTPVYGVMRTELLRKSGLIGSYRSSDTVLIEELLMLGPFLEVEDVLFFKRDHPGRSARVCRSSDNWIEWLTGPDGGRLHFPRWRIWIERMRAARRVPMPLAHKAACLAEMLRYCVWNVREVKAVVREVVRNAGWLIGTGMRRAFGNLLP